MIEAGDELGVCAINVAEFYAGIPPERRSIWDEFIDSLRYWGITRDAASQAGRFRYEFARKGIMLSTTDALIAAVAQERGAVVMTSNVKDYPMREIHILSLKD